MHEIFFNPLKKVESHSTASKPQNDFLLDQVTNLRRELQSLNINPPITIVTGSGSAGKKYGIIIVVVVVGYGYIWWKGWKLPDLRFATKRSLSDACGAVAKQLEDVYSSISSSQKHLSSKVTRVDHDVNKVAEISQATQEEVSVLRGRSKMISEEFQSVRDVVQNLEIKLSEIEGKQEYTTQGVLKLCDYAQRQGSSGITEQIQGLSYSSSKKHLESPTITPSSRTGSLPLPLELPSPSNANGSQKAEWGLHNSVSSSGLKDFNEISEMGESRSFRVPNGNQASEDQSNRSSSNGVFGLGRLLGASVLTRQRSVTNAVAQQTLSSGQQC
ncbi:uncharacterized protein LOC123214517 isoform X2 [Mangifera indica]|uniref:uncharacterized protein LOC123214517 isoform X2 n=1 Tax=Mangifera indica TaxID=29780 RepID=UPI001CFC2371|nr:uncharacterized protein LOC123214517 isoform X2 [Mangifera indica]